ncbi:MAG: DUF1667 domain-containing protein [Lachnospiraceae bacterium]
MEQKKLTCIGCPMGCELIINIEEGTIQNITGNICKRGEVYGREEMTHPTRIVTTTVKTVDQASTRIPVKTKTPIPKNKIFDCMRALKCVAVTLPIKEGDVVVSNVAGTGVDVVATKNVNEC